MKALKGKIKKDLIHHPATKELWAAFVSSIDGYSDEEKAKFTRLKDDYNFSLGFALACEEAICKWDCDDESRLRNATEEIDKWIKKIKNKEARSLLENMFTCIIDTVID